MASSAEDEPADQGMRASDRERHAVVERLEVAAAEGRLDPDELRARTDAAYAARTLHDLTVLTADLPRVGSTPVVPLGPVPGVPAVPAAPAATAPPVVAVFGGAERRGRWRPAARQTAVAVFGGVVLDYREAEPLPQVLHLRATAVFGGVDVVVPEGTTVEMSGFAVFGGRSANVASAAGRSGPVVRLRAVAVFGGVSIRSATPGTD
ncbi:DUF1707 domain-containing protein [Blastococcus sp. TF02A-26]|uniref:DUF1707 SHOCT-like domain-containing protein n=1 Tax=Blastococcus sp. TF02A-26 TaxID=2250577 RepID=UPI000DEADFCB|nr:DUF1707 domain-containing protein [Blastococcus sp. TF02A-26]RBY83332.1 hypothetical protein DQ240_16715 [Blastococcus sp. TF02A-26]